MIECRYGKQKRLFLTHTGELIPCCYLNSESISMAAGNSPKTKFGELNKMYNNSLYNNTIDEVINGNLFNGIIESWSTDTPVEKCRLKCEKKDIDIFEDTVND